MNERSLPITAEGKSYNLSARFRKGNEDLLVFLHGLGCSKEAFDKAWEHESIKNYSLLSFDLLGFGDSPKPEDVSYTVETQSLILAQVLEQHQNYRIHLVANSWGPVIALQLPESLLAKLASFANLEGRMVVDDIGGARKAAALSFKEFQRSLLPEMRERYRHDSITAYRLDSTLPQAYYSGATSLISLVGQGELPAKFLRLTCPKVYIYGDQNRELQSLRVLPSVPKIEITKAGHFMMKDNPKEFYSKLATFLEEAR